ncbi:Yip1 family protein [Anaerocolumna sp. MB42-C2]|uniref:Yip1 family protein n=1 Tax=Anaerocolumna sp. MB42-C2 TaxID=3070997 RepID=UPI0027DECDC8|nr:Yip1 family protein [Anaerocolumna sp. MB42-C2]WMJ86793.1 Yip1 family protein [Anaerocolumna sp. MB42-C2]
MNMKMKKAKASNPFYMIFHPFDASYDIRFKNEGVFGISFVILFIWFLASIMERQNTGFIFNHNKLSDLNVFVVFAKVVFPFAMWTCGNWVVSILKNGTGRFRDIWILSAYCSVPHIIAKITGIFLSNFLVLNEPFADYVKLFGLLWSLIILFIGTMIIHEYGFTETIAACIFSVGIMAVILFISVLVGNLYTEFINFIKTIFSEILFRL